ncbi:histidine kinase [Mesorhizobium sp. B2-8-1]|nr:histidine kinase [Mesorhizobium sp. B3-1-1]TPJ09671.1 histidine kinase [Mesorhizobium sp. B2-8-1]TPJ61982.1 histidine kinase [Mesorhizobium sp. B2-6-7]TPJ88710.1 histidine kinase [Mesorhizobium sp. B2-6-3]TPK03792.1 histidine kinase [Mesorhizobium sp. B2-5-10]TPK14231.1 histidine kinase [Mesorhizobium sp. B2-5-11]TPK36874.1 histidine kinase [Mesorhizobium sp. B2-5-8]TPK60352.1 histidine kinase [Mesorhizobium sp. B2-5-1]TPM65237.1 histidine kinase [Mesorhizobium sp. B2-1-9]TPM84070.1 his
MSRRRKAEPLPTNPTVSKRLSLRLWPRSLTFRVIAFSTVWAILTLIVIFTLITTLYRQASERGFDSLLSAHLFNLIGSIGISDTGALTGAPDLGDLRFSEPNSGWYWSVEPASEGVHGNLHSSSMTRTIPSPDVADVPFNANFQRSYAAQGIDGEELVVFESEFVLDAKNRAARFRVMGNKTELEQEIATFQRRLLTYLSLFGVGMIAINAIAILLGLQPLRRVRDALAMVREGTAQRLDGQFPAEIEPLANETNALIENNRRIVERSRTQVGNLAHSLKTPLAVLLNEGRALGGAKGQLIAEQAASMQKQVDHYLQRARVAAQRDSVVYRTPIAPLVQRMVRVLQKLNPQTNLSLSLPPIEIVFAGEREDLEELLGNLLENAMKWAKSAVSVSVVPVGDKDDNMFEIAIEDDGPGIPEEKAREALKRGRRLDETKPGTGLGLAIVADLVNEYGGILLLERSGMGGLKAVVRLRSLQ